MYYSITNMTLLIAVTIFGVEVVEEEPSNSGSYLSEEALPYKELACSI